MTKADEIRALLAEGHSRSEVARLAKVAYQQVYQIDKKRTGGSGGSYRPTRSKEPSWRPYSPRPYVPELHTKEFGERPLIRKGPRQDRIAVQDGHEVLLSDDVTALCCLNCLQAIVYSAQVQAYVHTFSRAPVTRTVATQSGPGLFNP